MLALSSSPSLSTLGWDDSWAEAFAPHDDLVPGRVARVDRGRCDVLTEDGEIQAGWHGDLPCAGLHKQYVGGTKKAPVIAYYCAWPTAEEQAAIATFDDSSETAYWDSTNAQNSVKTAGSLVQLTVTAQTTNGTIDVSVVGAPDLTP